MRELVALRTHVRQGDPSLTFDWHDDPSPEVRACPQNILYDALSVLTFWLYLIVAFSHLRTCPYAELAISQDYFQVTCPIY